MNDDEELRKFLVSSITLDDLNPESRNLMFKRLISAYCQTSTIRNAEFRTALINLKRFFDYSDSSWGRSMSYHEGGSDFFNPVALGLKIARMKKWFDIVYDTFKEDKENGNYEE